MTSGFNFHFFPLFFFFFWLHCMAYRILVPWLGIEPMPPVVEAQSPNHWTTREFPRFHFLTLCLMCWLFSGVVWQQVQVKLKMWCCCDNIVLMDSNWSCIHHLNYSLNCTQGNNASADRSESLILGVRVWRENTPPARGLRPKKQGYSHSSRRHRHTVFGKVHACWHQNKMA